MADIVLQRATGQTLSIGSLVAGDYTALADRDGVYLDVDRNPTIDLELLFSMSGFEPAELVLFGRLQGHKSAHAEVLAYNYATSAWETISTPTTQLNSSAVDRQYNIAMDVEHVNAGDGACRIRIVDDGSGNSGELFLDSAYIVSAVVGSTVVTAAEIADAVLDRLMNVKYTNQVYMDTVNGSDGDLLGSSGTIQFPVKTLANALGIAESIGVTRITPSRESAVVLGAPLRGIELGNSSSTLGSAWQLFLNGQDISDSTIIGAVVDGANVQAVGEATFENCRLDNVTGPPCTIKSSLLAGALVLNDSGTLMLLDCTASVNLVTSGHVYAGSGTVHVLAKNYTGPLTVHGLKDGDSLEVTGSGSVTLDSSCTGGDLKIEGLFELDDQSGGSVNIDDGGVYNQDILAIQMADAVANETPEVAEIVQAIMTADFGDYEASATLMTLVGAGLLLMNATIDEATGEIIVMKTDDTTELGRLSVSFDMAAAPIVSVGV